VQRLDSGVRSLRGQPCLVGVKIDGVPINCADHMDTEERRWVAGQEDRATGTGYQNWLYHISQFREAVARILVLVPHFSSGHLVIVHNYCSTMSQSPPTASSSSSNFQPVLNAALDAYEKTTKKKLLDHPLATQLQSCDSPTAILSVLQDLIQRFEQNRSSDERLRTWLDPTVNVLFAFSATLGEGVSLVIHQSRYLVRICSLIEFFQVFSPAKVIFAGIGVLLLVSIRLDPSVPVIVMQGMLGG